MRIAVAGRTGRMGSLVVEEVSAAGAMLAGDHADAFIDFTHPDAIEAHARRCVDGRMAWILGTTGLGADAQAVVAEAARSVAVVQAANFSPGVTVLIALAERLGATLPASEYDAEIVDMHHRQKRDSPSGTALALGRAVARGRGTAMRTEFRGAGETGPRTEGAIGFASLRGGQVVGEHSLIFAAADEEIALHHRAFDRRSFARGAVRAALWSGGRAPGLYTMQDVLGISTL